MTIEIIWTIVGGLAVTSAWLGGQYIRLRHQLRVSRLEARRHEAVFENVPDAIISVDQVGRIVLFNPAAEQMFVCRSGEALGRHLQEFVDLHLGHPGDEAIAWNESVPGGTFMAREVKARSTKGQMLDAEASVSESSEAGITTVVLRDIAFRKRTERHLKHTQSQLIDTLRMARIGQFSYELSSEVWSLPTSLQDLLGTAANGAGSESDLFPDIHPDDRNLVRRRLQALRTYPEAGLNMEFRVHRRDTREIRWFHTLGRMRPKMGEFNEQLRGSMQDITDRKLATLALEQSQDELRELSANLNRAREEERKRVARDLHDELGQRLSALKLDLFSAIAHPDVRASGLDQRLQPLIQSVNNAVTETRRIASNLRPAMLDDLGLNAAVEWLAQEFSGRLDIPIELRCQHLEPELNEVASTTIYRIVQEGLTNIARHAHARHGRIEIYRASDALLIAVEDDGRGLSETDGRKSGSFGLAGIRERARILGGSSQITNLPQGGCRLEVRLPWGRLTHSRQAAEPTQRLLADEVVGGG